MKRFLTLLLALCSTLVFTQQPNIKIVPSGLRNTAPLSLQDAIALSSIEELILPDEYKSRSLPDSVDNSAYEWFRPIFSQTIYPNCMQSTSIAYNFTYEINRLRGLPADVEENQYTTHFAWNFFNGGNGWYGANYLYTMDVLKYHGNPTVADYGGMYYGGGERWMSGYEQWKNAMNNRISGIKQIYVGNEKGLLTLKHWLNDHLDGSETGGVASFIACSPYGLDQLPAGTPNAGKMVVTHFCDQASHGMTIVGYNDSIRFDYNGDGMYTNNIDLNSDGQLTMSDWEIGGVKMANSHGTQFADTGFAYVMYKTLADHITDGGIWANRVHVLFAKEEHNTRMTFKVALQHDYRERIRVRTGIASDTAANVPEHIKEYSIFNFQGGWHYMQGNDTTEDHKTIEFGLDVTPLLSYVETGVPFKLFLIVDEKDEENHGSGQVKYFSVIDHQQGDQEYYCEMQNVALIENGTTMLTVAIPSHPESIEITTQQLPVYQAGVPMDVQLEAMGGQAPYNWLLDRNYKVNNSMENFPVIDDELIMGNSLDDTIVLKKLDFSFPFYGNYFDSVAVSSSGYLQFDENMFFWSYLVDFDYFLKSNRVVAPLLSPDMMIYEAASNGIWYEGDETVASFRWKTALAGQSANTELNFALSLYPDGDIVFYYGDMIFDNAIRHVSGISNGDQLNHSLADLPEPEGIPAGTKVEFLNPFVNAQIELSTDGLLSILQNTEQTIGDINVIATDNTLLSAHKTYQLTDGIELDLYIAGSNHPHIPNGQLSDIGLQVKNRGNIALSDVNVQLSCSHPLVSFTNDFVNIGDLQPGQSVNIQDAFTCNTDVDIPDKDLLLFQLSCEGVEKNYEQEFFFYSSCPHYKLHEFYVDTENGILDPGIDTDIEIIILNEGSLESNNTTAKLHCNNPGITIKDSLEVDLGNIKPGAYKAFKISLLADYSIPNGSKVDFNLEVSDEVGLYSDMPLSLRVGKTPVIIVDMDPNQNSGPQIKSFLEAMEVESSYVQTFPNSFNNYQSVILCLGIHFSYHALTSKQSEVMVDYLNNGGNIYMEGRIVWNQNDQWEIFDMFNIDIVSKPGLYDTLRGVDSTFTEGLGYANSAAQPVVFYYLEPVNEGYSILTGTGDYPFCAAVANDAGDYKTIGAIFELGALTSSDTCQVEQYIQEVLDFFGVLQSSLDIDEIPEQKDYSALQNYPNPFTHQTKIPLTLNKFAVVEASVYDISGRRICTIQHAARLDKGHHVIRWDGKDEAGTDAPGGIYIYRLLVDGVPLTGKMVLVR